MLANNAEKNGLIVPEFSQPLQEKLKEMLPATASFKNPIDVTFDMNLPYYYITLPELLMKSGEVDMLIQYGVVGFQDVMDNYLKHEKIAACAEFRPQDHEKVLNWLKNCSNQQLIILENIPYQLFTSARKTLIVLGPKG